MKTKLKYLLCGLLTLISLSSTTYALTLRDADYGNYYNYLSTSNGYNLEKNSNSQFGYYCLRSEITPSEQNDKRYQKGPAVCEDGRYRSIGRQTSSSVIRKNGNYIYDSYKSPYYYNDIERYIFVVNAVEVDGKIKFHKSKLKFSNSGLYNIKSKRGSNVFSVASIRGPGLTFVMKDDDQVRWATYVNNMYMLDGYAISLTPNGSSFVFDSYRNKAYEYTSFWSNIDANLYNQSLFSKLMNIVPTNVYEIAWNVGSDYRAYYGERSDHSLPFSLMEKRPGTKEDLKIIQEDLKASLTQLNEYSHYYIGMTPEELGISRDPKVPNASNSENNVGNQAQANYAEELKKYNQCAEYWSFASIYADFGRNCRDTLTGGYSVERTHPFFKIEEWNGEDSLTLEKTSDACERFKGVKRQVIKRYKTNWEEFSKDYQEIRPDPQRLANVERKCGAIPKKSDIQKTSEKAEGKNWFSSAWDWFRGRRGEPAMTTEDGEKLYAVDFDPDFTSLRSLYWQCQGLDRFGITKSFTQTPEEKSKACSDYASKKAEILKKWQGANLGDFYGNTVAGAIAKIEKKKNQDGVIKTFGNEFKESLSEGGEALLNAVQAPFNSGYNSVLPLQCSSTHRHIEIMDYFLWGLFAIVAFILFKFF